MDSQEFTCKCGQQKGWVTDGQSQKHPCPVCGRLYRGEYSWKTFNIEAIELKATKPWLPYWTPRCLRVIEFNIRTKIFKQRRYLIDKWSLDKK